MIGKLSLTLFAVALAAVGLLIGVRWYRNSAPAIVPELPVTSMPDGVYQIEPADYQGLIKSLTRLEAVFLPAESTPAGAPGDSDLTAAYVGSEACAECHRSQVDSFSTTAHALTCRLPEPEAFSGSLKNAVTIRTQSPNLWWDMLSKPDGAYQKLTVERGSSRFSHEERLDLVVGSGKLGQTFLYWKGDALFELPIGYFTEFDAWVNSPGYLDGTANFARPIRPGCIHCHATVIQTIEDSVNRYDKRGAVLGVSCERCHGPGRAHAEFHRSHPDHTTSPQAIINPQELSALQQIELCSQCHSGGGDLLKPAFTFQPGDELAEFLELSDTGTSGPGGVHSANQRARLSISKCFQNSPDMTCTSCHNPHAHERGQQEVFSKRCLECHADQDCGVVRREGPGWKERCVDCHMRRVEDTETIMHTTKGIIAPILRDHHISIDKAASARILHGGSERVDE